MSGIAQGHQLVIDITSLPTLARRIAKELPGVSFEVMMSAREGKCVVRTQFVQRRAEFRQLVQSL